ncbi:MAG: organomercurial lyase [Acidimicrobiia bacterium]
MDQTTQEEHTRVAIFRMLATTWAAPTEAEVAVASGTDINDVRAAFDALAADRHIVLAEDRTIVMAHPFSTINLGFSVMGHDTLWWGGCVWDSLAIPHLVTSDDQVLVATTCQGCGTAHSWMVDNLEPPTGDQIAHFLTPMSAVWDDVVHACGNQRVFCDEACLDRWLSRENLQRGYVADLPTVWRLASRWYEGRLDSPYVRREPVEAREYFRSVGLHGPFWGLE